MTMKTTVQQTLTLVKKNFKLKRRKPYGTCMEIVLPLALMLLLGWIRSQIDVESFDAELQVDSFGTQVGCLNTLLTIAPNNEFTQGFADFAVNASDILNGGSSCVTSATLYDDEDSIIADIVDIDYASNLEHVVIFDSTSPNWEYTIRINSDNVPSTDTVIDNFINPTSSVYSQYLFSGFLPVQRLVDEYILAYELDMDISPGELLGVFVGDYPQDAYSVDSFWEFMDNLQLFIYFSFMLTFNHALKSIVEDKETKIKEGMKMNGVSETAIWASWFITYALISLVTSILLSIVMRQAMFKNSGSGGIFIFIFLYYLSLISYAFLCSAFFSKSKSASNWGTMIFFLGYIVAQFIDTDTTSKAGIEGSCLLSGTCFTIVLDIYAAFETVNIGLTPDTYSVELISVTFSSALGLLFFDSILYLLLAWYFTQILPSEFGVPLPFYFIFTKSYWCPEEKPEGNLLEMEEKNDLHGDLTENFEPISDEMAQLDGLRIKHLVRQFGSGDDVFTAVNDISLNIYEGEVFALLGHNGAGKTTTISMLTGLIPVTSGDADVFGRSISTEMNEVHKIIGVCPQVNVLYDNLTVKEHLEMFARLRQIEKSSVPKLVADMIEEIGLTEKTDSMSSTLSGGQKRKLSVAIAFIGDPKVVFLDEPTSGMDVHSRRSTWDIIKKYKKGKVIILTTHFMDEADLLGDRIAIMSHGEIVCCGTSLFLKNRYGVGYTMVVTRSDDEKQHIDEDNSDILEVIEQRIEGFSVLNNIGNEVFVQIPFSESPNFPGLFREFDDRAEELRVQNYAVSVTTLEEVFLKVGEIDHHNRDSQINLHQSSRRISQEELKSEVGKGNILELMKQSGEIADASAFEVYWRHSRALLVKRFHHYKRDRLSMVFQILIPSFFMIIGVIVQAVTFQTNFESLNVGMKQYEGLTYPLPYYEYTSDFLSLFEDVADGVSVDEFSLDSMPSSSLSAETNFSTYDSVFESFATDVLNELNDVRDEYDDTLYGCILNASSLTYSLASTSMYNHIILSNYSAFHGFPALLNGISNSILHGLLGTGYSIEINNHPRPLTFSEEEFTSMIQGFILTFYFLMAAAMIPGSFVTFIVHERECKSKHQQMISGVSVVAYWLTNMIWDSFTYFIPFAVAMILLEISGNENWIGEDSIGATVAVFLLYGFSIIPMTYLLSMLFKKPGTARGVSIALFFVTGLILSIASNIMESIESTADVNESLKPLYRLFPIFCFGDSLYKLSLNFAETDPWDPDIVGTNVNWMIAEIFIYIVLMIVVEYLISIPKVTQSLRRHLRLDKNIPKSPFDDDEDVANHREAIKNGEHDDEQVVVKGLRKIYGDNVAVKDLWLAMPQGQCFGFLGINGAGKTTTLSILSGDLPPTTGTARLSGLDVLNDQLKMRRLVGYCPQFDALFNLLTGREHLTFYARIKGVPEDKLESIVDGMLHYLSLDEYADRPAGTYSGGNKRKLSVAMALIGDPPIVFLDEPSTGMDPVSRRFMWKFISETMAGRVVVLTTHSMEECEALCNRIAIMVSGRLRCLGTPQHLKNRFGQGFQLDISCAPEHQEMVRESIEPLFNGATLIEMHEGILKFKIPQQEDRKLAEIFEIMEENREELHVREYAVGQTTLEQIFIYFAQQESKAAGIIDSAAN